MRPRLTADALLLAGLLVVTLVIALFAVRSSGRNGTIGPIGAASSKPFAMHQGRPCFFMSFCRSRRVMSRPTA